MFRFNCLESIYRIYTIQLAIALLEYYSYVTNFFGAMLIPSLIVSIIHIILMEFWKFLQGNLAEGGRGGSASAN